MEQDLREMFNEQKQEKKVSMRDGHESRFVKKLDTALPRKKKDFYWYAIAASIALIFTLGLAYLNWFQNDLNENQIVDIEENNTNDAEFSFGDLSPELKKVEQYYVANINLELSKLEVSEDTKDLVDSYMEQLSELNEEYKNLNKELMELGPNDQTINALITNLQFRLQLLQKLKKKLNELKKSKNEQITTNNV